MILYTVIPLDDVLQGLETDPPATLELVMEGVLVELEPCGDLQAKVVRVLSSNPYDYLTERNQPGRLIRWT